MELKTEKLDQLINEAAAFDSSKRLIHSSSTPAQKIFPTSISGGKHVDFKAKLEDGMIHDCVYLNTEQAQANRCESALMEALNSGSIKILPHLALDLSEAPDYCRNLYGKNGFISSLELPHRTSDGWFRFSTLDGVGFFESAVGRRLVMTTWRDLMEFIKRDISSLVFGMWAASVGVHGTKISRAITSNIVGVNWIQGKKVGSRSDPLVVTLKAGKNDDVKVFLGKDKSSLTLDEKERDSSTNGLALTKLGMSNIPPDTKSENSGDDRVPGGQIDYAIENLYLSNRTVRKMQFPVIGATPKNQARINVACRRAVTALCMASAMLSRKAGYTLRSGCDLALDKGQNPSGWTIVMENGDRIEQEVTAQETIDFYNGAIDEIKSLGVEVVPETVLKPAKGSMDLLKKQLQESEAGLRMDRAFKRAKSEKSEE